MVDLVSRMKKSERKSRNIILMKRVSKRTSKKFAFLMGGSKVRNCEAVIGINNKHFKVNIDSNGELSVSRKAKSAKRRSKQRN